MCLNLQKVNYIINEDGKFVLDFNSQHLDRPYLTFPCGKCPECLEAKSRDWAVRCMIEKKSHNKCCILTLTYKETDGELHRENVTNFIKRLRKYVSKDNIKIRYFGCGEYGDLGKRPHFHLIIYGWCPNDLVFKFRSNDHKEKFTSKTLEKLWKNGWVLVDPFVDFKSCKYSAKYMQKLNTIGDKTPPFLLYSKNPAIGCINLEDFSSYLYNDFYFQGNKKMIPKSILNALSKYYDIPQSEIDNYKRDFISYLKNIKLIKNISDTEYEYLLDFYQKKWNCY